MKQAIEARKVVTLFDLWEVLHRRKAWLVAGVVVGIAAGIVVSVSRTAVYRYSTAIEIGSYPSTDGRVLVESPKSVIAKILQVYLPIAVDKLQPPGKRSAKNLSVSASVPPGGQFVVLTSYGKADAGPTFRKLHEAILKQIEADHDRILAARREHSQVDLTEHKNKLADLREEGEEAKDKLARTEAGIADELAAGKDKIADFQAQLKHAAVHESVLSSQEKDLRGLMNQSEKERNKLLPQAKRADAVLLLMLVDNNLRYTRSTLGTLQERIAVEIPNRKDELRSKVASVERQQSDLHRQLQEAKRSFAFAAAQRQRESTMEQAQIANIRAQLDSIQGTHALVEAMRSGAPIGPNRLKYPLLTGMVGLVVGILLAFALEIFSWPRRRSDS